MHDSESDLWTLFDDEKVRHIPGANAHGPVNGGGSGGGTASKGKGARGKGNGGRGALKKVAAAAAAAAAAGKGSSGDDAAAAESEADAEFLREVGGVHVQVGRGEKRTLLLAVSDEMMR